MMIIHSTTPGHVSFTKEYGSPFIKTFCEKVEQLSDKENLASIVSHVIESMETLEIDKNIRQIPQLVSTMGVVFLKPKGTFLNILFEKENP